MTWGYQVVSVIGPPPLTQSCFYHSHMRQTPLFNGVIKELAPIGNPKLLWQTDRLIKEGGYVDLFMDTLHLKDSLVLFRLVGSALTPPLFLFFSPSIIMLCYLFSKMTKDHFLVNVLWH